MRNKKANPTMRTTLAMLALIAVMLGVVMSGCSSGDGAEDAQESSEVERGEHEREGGEGGEGEESGNTLTLDETYDTLRKGTRLIMNYDKESNTFVGTVENTTESTLEQVRVEVHLSNGIELGPTKRVDLAAGQKVELKLPATDEAFDGWTPHAEVGAGEHGGEHGGGEGGEHGGEGEGGEHGSEGEGGEHGSGEGGD